MITEDNDGRPTKTCTQCKRAKPATEFFKNKRAKDGLAYHCKVCDSAYSRYFSRGAAARADAAAKRDPRIQAKKRELRQKNEALRLRQWEYRQARKEREVPNDHS